MPSRLIYSPHSLRASFQAVLAVAAGQKAGSSKWILKLLSVIRELSAQRKEGGVRHVVDGGHS